MQSILRHRAVIMPDRLARGNADGRRCYRRQARTFVVYQCLSEEEIVPLRDGFVKYWQETQNEEIEWEDFFQPCGEIRATVELEMRGNAVQADVLIADIGDFATLEIEVSRPVQGITPPALSDPEFSSAVRESAERTKTNFVIGLGALCDRLQHRPSKAGGSAAELGGPS